MRTNQRRKCSLIPKTAFQKEHGRLRLCTMGRLDRSENRMILQSRRLEAIVSSIMDLLIFSLDSLGWDLLSDAMHTAAALSKHVASDGNDFAFWEDVLEDC